MQKRIAFKSICIFEDERFPNFFPLSLDRPVFEIDIGSSSIRKRIIDESGAERVSLLCRPYLARTLQKALKGAGEGVEFLVNEPPSQDTLFVNGRLLALGDDMHELTGTLEPDSIIHKNGIPVAAYLSEEKVGGFCSFLGGFLSDDAMVKIVQNIKKISEGGEVQGNESEEQRIEKRVEKLSDWAKAQSVRLKDTKVKLISHIWQLMGENRDCITDDFRKNPLRGSAPDSDLFKGVDIIKEEDIVIGSDTEVKSGTVLDASEGPIIIEDNVKIEPNAIIYGPCYIGSGSIIRGGAKIGHGTSVGRYCRIGGEVEETIFSPYTNKQHEGFIGHSYISSWVNIGAGSCNSDLKNNYGYVKAWSVGRIKDTGRRFLGVIIGSHSKVAINTRFNTGTVVGFNANVMTTGFPPKFIPSFSWQVEPEFKEFDLSKAMETARTMMARRDVDFTEDDEELFKAIHRFVKLSSFNI